MLFETFLMTGMREQGLMHLTWRDVDLTHDIVRVRHKPEYGWTPKAYKEPQPDGSYLPMLVANVYRYPRCIHEQGDCWRNRRVSHRKAKNAIFVLP